MNYAAKQNIQVVADMDDGNVKLETSCQLFEMNSNFPSFRQFNGSPFRQITITTNSFILFCLTVIIYSLIFEG